MALWFHITPLFLLPEVFAAGGFRCGKDLAAAGSPRRFSSRADDDRTVDVLGGRPPSEFVMMFRNLAPPLLDEKIRGTRKKGATWRAYPHARFTASAERCLAAAGGRAFGSPDNIGRTLRKGLQPRVTEYTSPVGLKADGVEEILLDADRLPDRRLPLATVDSVTTFSEADAELVREHLNRIKVGLAVGVDPKKGKYAEGQRNHPGADFLTVTRRYYEAVWAGDTAEQQSLRLDLQVRCFD